MLSASVKAGYGYTDTRSYTVTGVMAEIFVVQSCLQMLKCDFVFSFKINKARHQSTNATHTHHQRLAL